MATVQLWMLALGHFTNDFFVSIVPPLMPFFVREFGFSVAQVAALATAITAGSGLLQPVFGAWIDRSDRTWLLPLTILWVGVLVACFGLLNQYWLLFVVALLAGLGSAVFHPLATVSIRAVVGRFSAGALSIFSIGGTAGMAVVPLVSVALVSYGGMRGLLWLSLPTVLVVGILYARGMHRLSLAENRFPTYTPSSGPAGESATTSTNGSESGSGANSTTGSESGSAGASADDARTTSANDAGSAATTDSATEGAPRNDSGTRSLVYLSVATLIRTTGQSALTSFLPLYAAFKGFGDTTGGLLLTLHLVAGSLAAIASGYLSDRWGRKPVVVYSSVLATPAFLAFLYTEGLAQVAALFVVSFFLFATFSVAPIYAQEIVPERPGMGAGLMMGAVWSIAAFLLIPLGTLADNVDLHAALFIAAWLPLASIPFLLAVPETHRVRAIAGVGGSGGA